jgi:hypothetical protein
LKKLTAVSLTAMGLVVVPMTIAPTASADVCSAAGGRHFSVGDCTNVAGDAAAVAIVAQLVPYYPGEIPCYTAEGVPYYTPDDYSC